MPKTIRKESKSGLRSHVSVVGLVWEAREGRRLGTIVPGEKTLPLQTAQMAWVMQLPKILLELLLIALVIVAIGDIPSYTSFLAPGRR